MNNMKKIFLILCLSLISITGFSQKKLSYSPKVIDKPEEVLEQVIQNDPKQGKRVSDVHITKFMLSIARTKFVYQPSVGNYDKVSYSTVMFSDITKLQLIHENKEFYILEVYDSRRSKKQFIIYSYGLEDLQQAYDALYTLKQRAIESGTKK